MIIIFVIALLLALGAFYLLQVKESSRRREQEGTDAGSKREQAWHSATNSTNSAIEGFLLAAARPFSVSPLVEEMEQSSLGRHVQSRLLASGGTFGNSVEVFFSIQVVAFVTSILLILGGLSTHSDFYKLGCALGAFGVVAYPWNIVSSRASKRSSAIIEDLPSFAELLQMYITSGSGDILSGLKFTASRSTGIVADTVSEVAEAFDAGALSAYDAFTAMGERLGTPSTRTFFNTLYSAYDSGDRVTEAIAGQSSILRDAAFQAQRANIKKIPIRLLIATTIHLFPLLLILALLPAAVELSRV